jgi:integrase
LNDAVVRRRFFQEVIVQLSAKKVEKLKMPGRYHDGHGLYLQVVSPTNRSWVFKYERAGRERMLGLGPLHTFSLAEARQRARAARQQLADGIDPVEAKKALRVALKVETAKTITFETAAREYFAQHEKKWKNPKHSTQFLSSLQNYAFDIIGELPVSAIYIGQVLKVLERKDHEKYPGVRLWDAITETANRVRKRIEVVLDWSAVRGYRATGDNPARWTGHLENVLPARHKIRKTEHFKALPYAELPTFYGKLQARNELTARALQFAILTAARTAETLGATWDEIDFANRMWTIPATRIKAAREHRVPLSDAAIAILRALPREDGTPFLFIGARTGAAMQDRTLAAVVRRVGGGATVHGFRSTFRQWGAEQTAFPSEMLEMALAHAVGTATERAYQRSDLLEKRRRLMQDWAEFCSSPTSVIGDRNNVVAIRAS